MASVSNIKSINSIKSLYFCDGTRTYATWNPSDTSAGISLSNGNLTATRNSAQGNSRATTRILAGTPYWEIKIDSSVGTPDIWLGVANISQNLATSPGEPDLKGWAIALDGGDYHHGGTLGTASGTWPAAVNDIFGFALHKDNSTLSLYRNNVLLTPSPMFTNVYGPVFPILFVQFNTVAVTGNFGATPMGYTAPSGYTQGLYI